MPGSFTFMIGTIAASRVAYCSSVKAFNPSTPPILSRSWASSGRSFFTWVTHPLLKLRRSTLMGMADGAAMGSWGVSVEA